MFDAIKEAKSVNVLLDQAKLKIKSMKSQLEQRTTVLFMPPDILELREKEKQAIMDEIHGIEQSKIKKDVFGQVIEVASSLGHNHKRMTNKFFNEQVAANKKIKSQPLKVQTSMTNITQA